MYIILGLGQQGCAILRYLLKHDQQRIITYDPDVKTRIGLTRQAFGSFDPDWFSRWDHNACMWSESAFRGLRLPISSRVVVISCLPPRLSGTVIEQCLQYGFNYIDLGGDDMLTEELIRHYDEPARNKNLIITPDCGVAPGLVSTLIGNTEECFDGIRLFCGGLPLYPDLTHNTLGYVRSFSCEGLVNEYTGTCWARKRGYPIPIPALCGRELIPVDGLGILEAAYTRGSISRSARTASDRLRTIEYKTLRYPGHYRYVRQNILNQPDPASVFRDCLKPVGSDNPDLLVLHIQYLSWDHVGCEVAYRWDYDHTAQISAMAQATGYTVGATAKLYQDGFGASGVVEMDQLPIGEILDRIKLEPNQMKCEGLCPNQNYR